ncbi:hypothetical protein [Pandoraea sp. NPDC087047]|uniref:hypothetical protein n=1 Tax=Pandoraea sp. NPDC087047 TaxID=3364390 RepID=UPI003830ABB1
MTRASLARPPHAIAGALAIHRARGIPIPSRNDVGAADSPVDSQALAHAFALHAANDLEGAARAFAEICRTLPEHTGAYKAFGYVLCQLGDHEHAIAPLMIAVAREYGDPEPLYFAALCMQKCGDAQTARDMANDALEMVRSSNRHADLRVSLERLLGTL